MIDYPENKNLLSLLAANLADDSAYMSNVLEQYLNIEGIDGESLQDSLGLSAALYKRLALCKRPEMDSESFATDVETIADFVLLDVVELTRIIRLVDSVEGLKSSATDSQMEEASIMSPEISFAAARDRENEDDNLPPKEK